MNYRVSFQIIKSLQLFMTKNKKNNVLQHSSSVLHCLSTRMLTTTINKYAKVQKVKKTSFETDLKDDLLNAAIKDMEKTKDLYYNDFNRHFSLKTDLNTYENCNVILPNGETRKMNELGRLTIKNSEQIIINFEDNPSAIKPALTALLKSSICANPQQEGVIIYIPIPKPTRELREKIVANSKRILVNYKEKLNNIYREYSVKNELNSNKDDKIKKRNQLLSYKKWFADEGETYMKEKQKIIMKEI